MSSTIIELINLMNIDNSNIINYGINNLDKPIKLDNDLIDDGKYQYIKIPYDENQNNTIILFEKIKKIDDYAKSKEFKNKLNSYIKEDLKYLPIIRESNAEKVNYVKIKLDNAEIILDYDNKIKINEIRDDITDYSKYLKCQSIIDFTISIDKIWIKKNPLCVNYNYGFIFKFDFVRIYKESNLIE